MTNTVLAHISCQVDILRVASAAIREQDHGAGAHSVHVTRNRTGAGPGSGLWLQDRGTEDQGPTSQRTESAGNEVRYP